MKSSHHKHNNYSWWRRWRGSNAQISSCLGCAHTYFTFVSQLKVFLSSVKVYSASEGSGILPFVRPDDFGCELMEGDAEGGKWQMSGNERKKRQKCVSGFCFFTTNAARMKSRAAVQSRGRSGRSVCADDTYGSKESFCGIKRSFYQQFKHSESSFNGVLM